MFKYTKHSLKKLEEIFKEIEYQIRYERGNFQSGYCIVEDRSIAVINKFYDTEARINVLLEILSTIEDINMDKLTESSATFYNKIVKLNAKLAKAEEEEATEVESTEEEPTEPESTEEELTNEESAESESPEKEAVEPEPTEPEHES